jgi:hypothetical protein
MQTEWVLLDCKCLYKTHKTYKREKYCKEKNTHCILIHGRKKMTLQWKGKVKEEMSITKEYGNREKMAK